MARYNYDVNTLTRYIDVHKQFSGGLKTVDTDDALGPIFLREAQNLSLSEFGFIEKRYGLIENLRYELGLVRLQGYFEYVEKDQSVTRILIGKPSNVANTPSKIYFAYSDGTSVEVTPELNPLSDYSENFKDSTLVSNFEILHNDDIQAVRLGDVLYIFTGVYPLIYSGKQFDETFTVTYSYGDGSELNDVQVTYPAFTNLNETDDYPPAPTGDDILEGFIPFGWIPSEIPSLSENTVVEFEYTRDVKTVNFYLDENLTELYATRYVVLGSDVNLPPDPIKENEGFVGWIAAEAGFTLTDVQTDANFYADFQPFEFFATVRFENTSFQYQEPLANGQDFSYNVLSDFETELGEIQYQFDGLFVYDTGTGQPTGDALTLTNGVYSQDNVTGDIDFIVTSTEKQSYEFRLRYTGQGLFRNDDVETLYEGQDFTFNAPNISGYTFDRVIETGTSNTFDGGDANIQITGVDQAYDLTAEYNEIVTYTVTFKDGYTGATLKTETVQAGGSATAPTTPTRSGYIFDGWDTSFTNVQSNLTVSATWVEDQPLPKLDRNNLVIEEFATSTSEIEWRVKNNFGFTVTITHEAIDASPDLYVEQVASGQYTSVRNRSGLSEDTPYNVYAFASASGYQDSDVLSKSIRTDSSAPTITYSRIIYENWDGAQLDTSQQLADGGTYTASTYYGGSTPTRTDPAGGTYTFTGWSPSSVTLSGSDVTVTAQFSYAAPPVPTVDFARVKMDIEGTSSPFFRTYQYQFSDQSASSVNVDNQNYTTFRTDFPEGEDLQITATDNFTGYEFFGWYVNGSYRTSNTTLTLTNITSSVSLEARYIIPSGFA